MDSLSVHVPVDCLSMYRLSVHEWVYCSWLGCLFMDWYTVCSYTG